MRQTNRLRARIKVLRLTSLFRRLRTFELLGPPTKPMNSGRTAVAARSQELNLRGIKNDQQGSGRHSGARAARSHRAGDGHRALCDKLKNLMSEGQKKIVLNMDHIEHIDGFGLGVLIAAHLSAKAHGASLKPLSHRRKIPGSPATHKAGHSVPRVNDRSRRPRQLFNASRRTPNPAHLSDKGTDCVLPSCPKRDRPQPFKIGTKGLPEKGRSQRCSTLSIFSKPIRTAV